MWPMNREFGFWDEWRGHFDGTPVFMSRTLFRFRGRKVCLHKIVCEDKPDCFHSHPALALRFILWGGYIEEWPMGLTAPNKRHVGVGMGPIVKPNFVHRIDKLANGRVSISLWIRGKKTHSVKLVGEGWARTNDKGIDKT